MPDRAMRRRSPPLEPVEPDSARQPGMRPGSDRDQHERDRDVGRACVVRKGRDAAEDERCEIDRWAVYAGVDDGAAEARERPGDSLRAGTGHRWRELDRRRDLHPPAIPRTTIAGRPRRVDEVQYAPGLFRHLKAAVDRDRAGEPDHPERAEVGVERLRISDAGGNRVVPYRLAGEHYPHGMDRACPTRIHPVGPESDVRAPPSPSRTAPLRGAAASRCP